MIDKDVILRDNESLNLYVSVEKFNKIPLSVLMRLDQININIEVLKDG